MLNDIEKLNVGDIFYNVDLKKYTTYKVGGTASVLVLPDNVDCLIVLLKFLRLNNIKHKIIGNGSNLVFLGDYNGVLIRLDKLNDVSICDDIVVCDAGCSLIALALKCAKLGLSGLEFASGIPGTVGGAIYMNAGAYLENMAGIVQSVKVLSDDFKIIELSNSDLKFGYRSSLLQSNNFVCLSASLKLKHGNVDEILDLIEKRKNKRIETQPLEYPSAGSVFRNPDGESAWRLVEGIGYKGKRIGDAMVSLKHANFIINVGSANGNDIRSLIYEIRDKVKLKYNIELHIEQEFVE